MELVGKGCRPITGTSPDQVSFKFLSENRSEGIKVLLTGGFEGSNLTINVKCGNQGKNASIGKFKRLSDRAFEINMIAESGCVKLDVKPIYNYISGEAWILKAILMVVGLLLTFLGRQLVKPALFTLGFGSVFVLGTYGIFSYFITATTPTWALWALLALVVVIALLVAFAAVAMETVGYFCCGLALGYAFGNFIMMSVLVHTSIPNPATVMYGIMAISGVIFGFAMVKFRDFLMIVATSLFGALMVSRTFFMSVAALPAEQEILNMFKNGVPIPPVVWGYLALYVLLAGLGIWVQKSRKSPEWEAKMEINTTNGLGYYMRA